MRKPAFCICKNKDADQLRGNREADQRLCFRYTESTIPLLPQSEISSLLTGKIDNYKPFKFLLKFALWHDFLVHFSFSLKVR